MKDYYSYLEINKIASSAEIKTAYRKLALKWHPDKNNNSLESTEIFQEIQEAYEKLGNSNEKTSYDLKFDWFIGEDKHNDNIEKVALKRFKQENIEKLKKELKINPEITLDELGLHKNFEEKLKKISDKEWVKSSYERISHYIKIKREEKLNIFKLEEARSKTLMNLGEIIRKTEVKTWEINDSEYREIFSEDCNCHLSMNYIRSYENHIKRCLSKINELEIFVYSLKKVLEKKEEDLNKFKEASLKDIERQVIIYFRKIGKKLPPKTLKNWKDKWKIKISQLSTDQIEDFKEGVLKKLEKTKDNNFEKVPKKSQEQEETKQNDQTSNPKKEELDSKKLEDIVSILNIGSETQIDSEYQTIREEIKRIKSENIKLKTLEKRKDLAILRKKLSEKIDEEGKTVLNRFFYNAHKEKFLNSNLNNWKHKRNLNILSKKLKEEEITELLEMQEKIFKCEIDAKKLEEAKEYFCYQEQRV